MKIQRHEVKRQTIKDFADEHGLTMSVYERSPADLEYCLKQHGEAHRFFAGLNALDVKNGIRLEGLYGEGNTEEEAVADYARQLSEKQVVMNATGKDRKVFFVPVLVEKE